MQLTKIEKYLLGTAIVVLILLAFRLCNNDGFFKGKVVTIPNPLEQQKIKTIDTNALIVAKLKLQLDSSNQSKVQIVIKYRTKRDSIIIQAPDTCTSYLLALDKEHLKIDSINNVIITKQENIITKDVETIGAYKDLVLIKDYKHSVDSIEKIGLYDEIKHQKKRVVKAKVGGGLIGIGGLLVGFGVGKVIP